MVYVYLKKLLSLCDRFLGIYGLLYVYVCGCLFVSVYSSISTPSIAWPLKLSLIIQVSDWRGHQFAKTRNHNGRISFVRSPTRPSVLLHTRPLPPAQGRPARVCQDASNRTHARSLRSTQWERRLRRTLKNETYLWISSSCYAVGKNM